ncbi:hypothetical protein NOZE110980_09090 [Nocardioides zeicaulis]
MGVGDVVGDGGGDDGLGEVVGEVVGKVVGEGVGEVVGEVVGAGAVTSAKSRPPRTSPPLVIVKVSVPAPLGMVPAGAVTDTVHAPGPSWSTYQPPSASVRTT